MLAGNKSVKRDAAVVGGVGGGLRPPEAHGTTFNPASLERAPGRGAVEGDVWLLDRAVGPADPAAGVAVRRLALHDPGPEICQKRGTERPGHHPGQIKHAQAGQGFHSVGAGRPAAWVRAPAATRPAAAARSGAMKRSSPKAATDCLILPMTRASGALVARGARNSTP